MIFSIALTAVKSYCLVSCKTTTDYWYSCVAEVGATFNGSNIPSYGGTYFQADNEVLRFGANDPIGSFVGAGLKYGDNPIVGNFAPSLIASQSRFRS